MLAHEELTGKIIAAAIQVHRTLGPGFIESVYEEAVVLELRRRGLSVQQQVEIHVLYEGVRVGRHILDLIIGDTIVVELKAVKDLDAVHFAVVRSYLRASGKQHGLLLNFAKTKLEIKRVICTQRPEEGPLRNPGMEEARKGM